MEGEGRELYFTLEMWGEEVHFSALKGYLGWVFLNQVLLIKNLKALMLQKLVKGEITDVC